MSDITKHRLLAIVVVAIFGMSVYLMVMLYEDKSSPAQVLSGPASEATDSDSVSMKINSVPALQIDGRLEINSASAEDIYTRLKGIGPKTAQSIVDYREKYGFFETLDDLQAVKGIGPATIRDIERQITFSKSDKQ